MASSGDEPVRVEPGELAPATCLECRMAVWSWPGAWSLLDLVEVRGDRLLSLHPCFQEIEPEDLDDPDWGWVEAEG